MKVLAAKRSLCHKIQTQTVKKKLKLDRLDNDKLSLLDFGWERVVTTLDFGVKFWLLAMRSHHTPTL